MSTTARLAGFVATLAAVFGAAALAGGALDPDAPGGDDAGHDRTATAGAGHDGDAHGGEAMPGATAPRGLAVAANGLRLDVATPAVRRGAPSALRFRVLDEHGRPVRAFGVSHTRRMHLIVVRRDLTGFAHLHPRMRADGTWTTPVRLPQAGSYRVFADFTRPGGTPVTLASDVRVDGAATLHDLPAPSRTAVSDDGYDVRTDSTAGRAGVASTVGFTITRNGRPVHVEPYLGADGHLVALREGDLAFLHVHPVEQQHGGDERRDDIAFETTLPTAGRYRLFLQFRHAGRIHTVAFTRTAA